MNIKPKKQPKWYQLRKRICRWLVNLARWVEPRSEEVNAFYMQQMMDMMITGCSITRIDPATHLWEIPPDLSGYCRSKEKSHREGELKYDCPECRGS